MNAFKYELRTSGRPMGVHFLGKFEQVHVACLVHFATAENRDNIVSVYEGEELVAVYTGDINAYIVIDGKLWENATDRDDFSLDTWEGISVNSTPFSPARTAAIVEGPKLREEDLTQYPFSPDGFLDTPFPARDLNGNWYLVK